MSDNETFTKVPADYIRRIRASGKDIYSPVEIGSDLWIPSVELERLLDAGMRGLDLAGFPLRTRSKVIKTRVCEVLGYPVPTTFTKTRPRFPGQKFDTYGQKANNLQVWNDELEPTRRYVILKVGENDVVEMVKVVNGDMLAKLDTTGTLTQKYQARLLLRDSTCEMVSATDTEIITPHLAPGAISAFTESPAKAPASGRLLSIHAIYRKLCSLVGTCMDDPGSDQERNRGGALHKALCTALGYATFGDDGQFPDIRHQLLEVKLQTSPTIDLGLVLPSSTEALDVPKLGGSQIRHCDVRYALFYGVFDNRKVRLTHIFLTTGRDFFTRFQQFQGKVLNKKLQIPLPRDFWTRTASDLPLFGK